MLVHQYTRLGSIRDRALRAAFRRAVERNDGFSEDMSRSRGRSASVPALFMAAQPRATCVPQLTRATWPIRGPPAEPAVRAETAQNNKQQSEPKQQSERKQLPIGVLSALLQAWLHSRPACRMSMAAAEAEAAHNEAEAETASLLVFVAK